TGYATIYTRDGQFQLYVQEMQEDGEGELYRRFLLYKTRLEAQGYFDEARKRKLPFLPACVGLVTAKTGAAVQDMYNVIQRRFPLMPIVLYPVTVQGDAAAASIAEGIAAANRQQKAQVLIVGRGGGSMEDLWAFNEPAVAKAIFDSAIPIISAVGHETDFTIADFVADLRAPTPSAAAELCVPEYNALQQWLDTVQDRLEFARQQGIARKKERLLALLRSYGITEVRHTLGMERKSLSMQLLQIQNNMNNGLQLEKKRLDALLGKLQALGPAGVMGRGYAAIQLPGGAYASSVEDLQERKPVTIIMQGGSANAMIDTITKSDRS
ncbi:MAG: exodeoxyribonuclease VII large subunit, partial [Eubacteriales bacterium]|nr:exodeoxyribonuclease VII large subunit [Eubacteriales bacterium]